MSKDAKITVAEIQKVLDAYESHLRKEVGPLPPELPLLLDLENRTNEEIVNMKLAIVINMGRLLSNSDPDDKKLSSLYNYLNSQDSISLDLNNRYASINGSLASPLEVLKHQRSPSATKFLENIMNLLTLGIYSKVSKGTFAFWKSHGEAAGEQINNLVEEAQKSRP
jgi:hypothetical protein